MNHQKVPIFNNKNKDYSKYWETQVLLVRILQNSGIRVGIKDRLPIFRLWHVVSTRMSGRRANNLLQLLQYIVDMRKRGMEPLHNGKQYL